MTDPKPEDLAAMTADELALHVAVWRELPSQTYHAGPGLSHSDAKRLHKSPFHYHALKQGIATAPPRKEPTPQMFNGTLVHCAVLEPDQFDKRYRVAPDVRKNTKVYQAFELECIAAGVEPISQMQRDAAFKQAEALRSLPEVAELLDGEGDCEVSCFWIDPLTGVLCKCRPDRASRVGYGRGAVLLDVKTTGDASPEGFAKACASFSYHTQADWYCEGYAIATGLDVHGMVFAAVESEYPHACAAYMLDDESLRVARERNRAARELYAQCMKAAEWPSYPRNIQVITLPPWALKE